MRSPHQPGSAALYSTCRRHAGAGHVRRSRPFSRTRPSFGSRSAIMRRNRLLPAPDGPVMAMHSPISRATSNGPARRLRSPDSSSSGTAVIQLVQAANFASSRAWERMPWWKQRCSNFSFGLCTWSSFRPKPISRLSIPSTACQRRHHRDRSAAAHQHRRPAVFLRERRLRRVHPGRIGGDLDPRRAGGRRRLHLRVGRHTFGEEAPEPVHHLVRVLTGTSRNETFANASPAMTVFDPGPV